MILVNKYVITAILIIDIYLDFILYLIDININIEHINNVATIHIAILTKDFFVIISSGVNSLYLKEFYTTYRILT
ncbi:hypothetical protein [Clostridium ganghwense]|uniref:Uncharacterized protein n=1 Tax=Clostridium ganghwense TaxID=312089 RepID=A0ABT4CTT4_9CLOT|nr:hypothetical protein [Clostridium ganghwense]MCY6372485.1 hypothetical protein [Clostridium ganghwense]